MCRPFINCVPQLSSSLSPCCSTVSHRVRVVENKGRGMGDPRAVGAQIRMKLSSLTPLEGKVAADILARKDIHETTPLREIALKIGSIRVDGGQGRKEAGL
jgi:hypothetical protein